MPQYVNLGFKNRPGEILVFSPTGKEHGFVPCAFVTRKKAEPTENQHLFLDPAENWGHRGKCSSENWTDR